MPAHPGHGLAALADPSRWAISEALSVGPCAVGELAKRFPISRPAVSSTSRRRSCARPRGGHEALYRIRPEGSWELCAYLDRVWNDAPVAFMAAVEHQQR